MEKTVMASGYWADSKILVILLKRVVDLETHEVWKGLTNHSSRGLVVLDKRTGEWMWHD